MKIERKVTYTEEFTPKPYMCSLFAWFRFREGNVIRISVSENTMMISVRTELYESDVSDGIRECTKTEFDAAYERAVQKLREAYLS